MRKFAIIKNIILMKGSKVQAVRTIVAVLNPRPVHVEVVSWAVGVGIEDEVYIVFLIAFHFNFSHH